MAVSLGMPGFFNFAGLDAFGADECPERGIITDDPDTLKIHFKTATRDTGGLFTDAAFFLGKAPPGYAVAVNCFFPAHFTSVRHSFPPFYK